MQPKPGYTTTEFWLTLLGHLAALITLLFHKDYTGQVKALAVIFAMLGTMVYTYVRGHVKGKAIAATAAVQSTALSTNATAVHNAPYPASGNTAAPSTYTTASDGLAGTSGGAGLPPVPGGTVGAAPPA